MIQLKTFSLSFITRKLFVDVFNMKTEHCLAVLSSDSEDRQETSLGRREGSGGFTVLLAALNHSVFYEPPAACWSQSSDREEAGLGTGVLWSVAAC